VAARRERGVRPARALPYRPQVAFSVDRAAGTVALGLGCEGAAAVLQVYDGLRLQAIPRRYTVAPGAVLRDQWALDGQQGYDLWLLGPNGFHRRYRGQADTVPVQAQLLREGDELQLQLHNAARQPVSVQLRPAAYAAHMPSRDLQLQAGASASLRWPAASTGGWYDLWVLQAGARQRLAGRAEDGRAGSTDPAMGLQPLQFVLQE